jgi:DNA-binding CsgD family transcriptional regulator
LHCDNRQEVAMRLNISPEAVSDHSKESYKNK